MSIQRSAWSSKWAFILAGAASAVGLGNMWRFPYLAAKYGGGTFIFVYLCLVFTVGISLLLLETSLGRNTGLSVIGAFKKHNPRWGIVGVMASAVPFIITPYYCVIGGWVTKYMTAYVTDGAAALADGGGFFTSFITSTVGSFVFMLIFMAIIFVVIWRGVKGGIEKVNLVLMPMLLVLAAGIAVYSLTLDGAAAGVSYYLIPDLSKLSPELFIAALGQMFFSMSLAMAIMVTYGSYLAREEDLEHSVASIAGFDIGVSLIAGLMIVPASVAVLGSGEVVAENAGPSLMFIILPEVFAQMGAVAPVLGSVFFLLVLFAALTSAISLTEACVSIVQDGAHASRRRACAIVFGFIFVAGCVVNLGYNFLSFIEPMGAGSSILDLADFVSNSLLMPVVALGTVIFVGWVLGPQVLVEEVKHSSEFKFERPWTIIIRYVAPVALAIIFFSYLAAQFGLLSF